jgi:hypothetical protein
MRLEVQAEAAETRAKDAEFRAAAANASLQELQRSGNKNDRKTFSKQLLDLKAEIALAESEAAQARAEAIRSRAAAIKDKASTASKLAADPSKDKKAQAKYYDALWLQQLAAKTEKDIAKADEDAAKKNKIAMEAAKKAGAVDSEIKVAAAKEAARQAKMAQQLSQQPDESISKKSKVYDVPVIAANDQAKTHDSEAALAAVAAKESARQAKAEEKAAQKAQEKAAAEQAKADREAAKQAKIEQEAARKAKEMAAAEQAKADREATRRAKAEQEMAKQAQAKEIAAKEEADRNAARKAKLDEEASRKAQEFALVEKAKADRAAAKLAEAQEAAKKVAAEKEAQTDAAKRDEEAKAARKAQERAVAQRIEADRETARKAKAEEFFREKKVVAAAVAPTIVSVADNAATDRLLEALRKKQSELDVQESSLPTKVMPVEAPKGAEVPVQNVEPIKIVRESAKPENFFREKDTVAATSNPVIIPAVATEPIQVVAASAEKSEQVVQSAKNTATIQSDADAQGDLFEILRRKQAELNAQETSGKKQETVVVTPKPAKPVTEVEQVPPAQPKAKPPVVAQPTGAPEDQDQLLEILRRKEAELNAQEAGDKKQETVVVTPKPAKPATEVEKARPPQPKPKVSRPTVVVSQPTVAPETQDQLVEILRKKQAELDAKEGVAPTKSSSPPSESVAEKDREKRIRQIEAEIKAKEEAFKKSAAQPTKKEEAMKAALGAKKETQTRNGAIILQPGSKEARLDELLRKYKADEITPHEYHFERAKIIAEP